jgi:hypothetical protein
LPLLLGGISELYHDVKTLVILEQIKLRDIYDEGIKQLGRIYNKGDNELVRRLEPLLQKFKQIEVLMKFASLSSFLDSLQNENFSSNYNWQQIYDNHANFITSSLKEEIPLLYYLILGKSSNELSLPLISNLPTSEFIPREILVKIIDEHLIVKDMLNPWIERIRECHDKSSVIMDNFLGRKQNLE